MTKFRTLGVAAALVLGLSACADKPGTKTDFDVLAKLDAGLSPDGFAACGADAKKITSAVNWASATTINVDIRQGQFSPSALDLDMGKAYVIKFTNRDDAERSFRAPEFFANSAVGQAKFGDQVVQPDCFTTLHFGREQTTEIQIVPQKDGHYRWHDNPVLFGPVFFRRDGFGSIDVHKS